MLTSGIGWPCVAYEFVRKGGNGISNRLSNILLSLQYRSWPKVEKARNGKGSSLYVCTYVHRTVPASRREVPVWPRLRDGTLENYLQQYFTCEKSLLRVLFLGFWSPCAIKCLLVLGQTMCVVYRRRQLRTTTLINLLNTHRHLQQANQHWESLQWSNSDPDTIQLGSGQKFL